MKSLDLVAGLTEKEVALLREKKAFQRGKSNEKLIKTFIKAIRQNKKVDKNALSKAIVGAKYSPADDNRIRAVLSRFNTVVEDFLVEQEVAKQLAANRSKYQAFLLEALRERKMFSVFDTTYKTAIDHALKNNHLEQATEMQWLMFYRQLDHTPITKELLAGLGPHSEVLMWLSEQVVLKTMHQSQRICAFLQGAGLPYEDRATLNKFERKNSVDLKDASILSPTIEFDYLQTIYFLTDDKEEKLRLLHRKIQALRDCQFEDYPYAKKLSGTLLNLAVQYIYRRDYQVALDLIMESADVLIRDGRRCEFRLIHSAMICCNILGLGEEAIAFFEAHGKEITNSKAQTQLRNNLAFSYILTGQVENVRDLLQPDNEDSITMAANKTALLICLIEEGEYLTAQNTCANLMVLVNSRAKAGSIAYFKESLALINDIIKVLLKPAGNRNRQLMRLKTRHQLLMSKQELSVVEMFTLTWIDKKIGEMRV